VICDDTENCCQGFLTVVIASDVMCADVCSGIDMNEQPASGGSSQRSTPNGEKVPCKLGREVCGFTFQCQQICSMSELFLF
jgi:hypothetical protein